MNFLESAECHDDDIQQEVSDNEPTDHTGKDTVFGHLHPIQRPEETHQTVAHH